MKVIKTFRLLVTVAVITPLLGVASVSGVARADSAVPNQTTDTAQTTATTLQERLDRRKTVLATKLTNAENSRLKARCQAAQAKFRVISQAVQTAVNRRTTVYRDTHSRLSGLVSKLDGEVDTADLEAALATLNAKTDAFEADAATYKQTAADLAAVDCVADPVAFKASLETIKADQAKLATDSAEIRTLVQGTIKPLLQAIRTSLAAKSGSNN